MGYDSWFVSQKLRPYGNLIAWKRDRFTAHAKSVMFYDEEVGPY